MSVDAGLTYPSFADLQLKEPMIKAASHAYLAADSTKINCTLLTRLGSPDMIHRFITDNGTTATDARAFEERGIRLLIAR